MANNITGMNLNRIEPANWYSAKDKDSPNASSHLTTQNIFPTEFSTSWKVKKCGEMTAAPAIHVPRMKKGHSLDLMSGERSGNITATNRSTVIKTRF